MNPCWIVSPAPASSAVQGAGGSASSSRPSSRSLEQVALPRRGAPEHQDGADEKQSAPPSTCRSACHEVGGQIDAPSAARSCGHGRDRRGRRRRQARFRLGCWSADGAGARGRTGQGGPPGSSGGMSIASPPSRPCLDRPVGSSQDILIHCPFCLACLVSAGRRGEHSTWTGHGQGPLGPDSAGQLTLGSADPVKGGHAGEEGVRTPSSSRLVPALFQPPDWPVFSGPCHQARRCQAGRAVSPRERPPGWRSCAAASQRSPGTPPG